MRVMTSVCKFLMFLAVTLAKSIMVLTVMITATWPSLAEGWQYLWQEVAIIMAVYRLVVNVP
jgi:hypothetical protein